MKANELMRENLVLFNGKPCKVTRINADSVCLSYLNENKVALSVPVERISPIHTTAEVLEKNGWRYNDRPFIDGWEQFGLTIHDGWIVCGQNVAADVSSVHQLQQFLSLCGIEKEITLDGVCVDIPLEPLP